MKQKLKFIFLTAAAWLLFISVTAQEQRSSRIPAWISEKGYWVVETNLNKPGFAIVYFYNLDGTKVYEESISGKPLNIKKRRTLMRLKSVLETTVDSWEEKYPVHTNAGLLAVLLQ